MTIKRMNRNLRTPLRTGIKRIQIKHKISLQRIEIPLRFLDLGLLLSTACFGDEVDGELVGGGAADEVGQVCELEGWLFCGCCCGFVFGIGPPDGGGFWGAARAGGGFFEGLGLTF